MSTAHFVHGFNVSDGGAGSTDRLIPYFQAAGLRACEHDYGWFGLLQVRFRNGSVADQIRLCAKPGDIGVGHSNGCAILAEATRRGAMLDGLVFINPALDEDCVVAPYVRWVHVYYNADDRAVWVARLLRFNHPWGAMGRVGFRGDDRRYVNIDCGKLGVSGHSDLLAKAHVWGPRIAERAAAAAGSWPK